MNDRELDRLAQLIADALTRDAAATPAAAGSWLPTPVRPDPPVRGGEAPVWSGAAQRLGDIAPLREPGEPSAHRQPTGEMAVARSAAAAGKGTARRSPPPSTRVGVRSGNRGTLAIEIPIGVSNRHLHISPAHFRTLFGIDAPTMQREISQPSQFAAVETVSAEGPRGRIDGIRIVGPARGETQLEVSITDARALGLAEIPIADSGKLDRSAGGVTLHGPKGLVPLARGVIVASRHVHVSPADATKFGLRDGDRVDVRCGSAARVTTFHGALVRSGPTHATEFHLDLDEAHAAGVRTGDHAMIVSRASAAAALKRPLITERELLALAARGGTIPANALLTPAARDRARALGLMAD